MSYKFNQNHLSNNYIHTFERNYRTDIIQRDCEVQDNIWPKLTLKPGS